MDEHHKAGFTNSFLEWTAVLFGGKLEYEACVYGLLDYAQGESLPFFTVENIDDALTSYYDELFASGDHVSLGRKTMAAWADYFPQFGKNGPYRLPRAARALKS